MQGVHSPGGPYSPLDDGARNPDTGASQSLDRAPALFQGFFAGSRRVAGVAWGMVALSADPVLANDIAGRGFPGLNIYIGMAVLAINVVLNMLWIPRYGIVRAVWASTVSYAVSILGALLIYCRLSGNPWTVVVLAQLGDWALYLKTGNCL